MPSAFELAQLIDPGRSPRKAGQGHWSVRCPAHEDNHPSLSVWVDEKGKAAFNCHTGCSHHDIADALPPDALAACEATWKPEPSDIIWPTRPPSGTPKPPSGVEAVYPYYDVDGTLLYEVRRYPGKRMQHWHPDEDGFMVAGHGPAPHVLYRLPELAANLDATIFLVEGEKDADTLASHGLVATTSGGVTSWKPEHAEVLAGAHIVILPDNDDPGRSYANTAATSLRPVAATVTVVNLPDLPDKGDVTDWLDAGHTIDDLEKEIRKARETPVETSANGIHYLNLREVLEGDFADEQWLVEPVIPKGRQTSIYATGKTGKSLLVLDIVAALASGRTILGRHTEQPRKVLYLDFEMTPGDLQERLLDLGYAETDSDFPALEANLHYAQLQPWHAFDTAAGGAQLEAEIDRLGVDLVVVDTFIRSVEGEENSSDTIKNFNRYTGQRMKARGVTLVRVDHSGKDPKQGQRGTSAKRDDVDLIWRIKEEPALQGTAQTLHLINEASRMSWVPQRVAVSRHLDPILHHTIPRLQISEKGVAAWRALKDLGAEPGITNKAAKALLRGSGHRHGNGAIAEAVRWLRREVEEPRERAGNASGEQIGERDADVPGKDETPW